MISYRLVSYENMRSAEFYDEAIKSHRITREIEQEFQYVECEERNEGEIGERKEKEIFRWL